MIEWPRYATKHVYTQSLEKTTKKNYAFYYVVSLHNRAEHPLRHTLVPVYYVHGCIMCCDCAFAIVNFYIIIFHFSCWQMYPFRWRSTFFARMDRRINGSVTTYLEQNEEKPKKRVWGKWEWGGWKMSTPSTKTNYTQIIFIKFYFFLPLSSRSPHSIRWPFNLNASEKTYSVVILIIIGHLTYNSYVAHTHTYQCPILLCFSIHQTSERVSEWVRRSFSICYFIMHISYARCVCLCVHSHSLLFNISFAINKPHQHMRDIIVALCCAIMSKCNGSTLFLPKSHFFSNTPLLWPKCCRNGLRALAIIKSAIQYIILPTNWELHRDVKLRGW